MDVELEMGVREEVDMLVVGVVRICIGNVGGIVRWLAEELE